MMELMIAVYAWNHKRIIVIQHLREFERQLLIAFIGSVVMLTGCVSVKSAGPPAQVVVESQPLLVDTRPCTNTFVPHRLPHLSRSASSTYRYNPVMVPYITLGSGVALADLNDNGLIDIILAGQLAPATLLWNQGGLRFRSETLEVDNTRAVNALDVDGDGRVDLVFTHAVNVFTHSVNPPSFWQASGSRAQPAFHRVPENDFIEPFYPFAIAWADLDDDGDLDMVGASYDTELATLAQDKQSGKGVIHFTNTRGALKAFLLASKAHSLAILLTDLDADGHRDILVGNDFDLPDAIFLNKPEGWIPASLFERTTANTMSFAEGDTDNDGSFEIFATDMKPYQSDPVWTPPLTGPGALQPDDGVQFLTNTLQFRSKGNPSVFTDQGVERGVDATGWSWSVQFGDLDNDGALDLYVVNGMMHSGVFRLLAGYELVEENQALRNDGTGHFVPAPEWGLGATESGRGMSFADLDNDGDLDIVVNNIDKPSVLFENRLCGGPALEVELHWEGSPNHRAIGAQLQLHTRQGSFYREMRLSSGYLSSLPARVHFGLGTSTDLQQLKVIWPDGRVSLIERPPLGTLLQVRRPLSAQ